LLLFSQRNVIGLKRNNNEKEEKSMQGSKLYVGNLKYSVTNDQLNDIFSNHGEVKSVNIIEGKGFGFVEMSSSVEAGKAKDALNDTDFEGRPLKIDEARPPKPRSEYRSNSRY
jgi:RNA recognition motif-containing protein